MKKVSFKINLAFSICVFLGSVYKYFIGSGLRMDLFIFYEHPKGGRLLSNILVDISNMVTISTVLLMWYLTTRKRTIKKCYNTFFNSKYIRHNRLFFLLQTNVFNKTTNTNNAYNNI